MCQAWVRSDREGGRNTPASLRELQSVAGTPFGEEPFNNAYRPLGHRAGQRRQKIDLVNEWRINELINDPKLEHLLK